MKTRALPLLVAACVAAACASAPPEKKEPPKTATEPDHPALAPLRAVLAATAPAERARALAELERHPVPKDPAERAALLRAALGRPARASSSRVTESFGSPPAETFFATPSGYDASGAYPTLIGLSAYCQDAHFSLQPFAWPVEEVAMVTTTAGGPRPRPVIDWEDGLVIAPTIPDIAEFDSSTYVPVRRRVLDLIAHANRHYAVDPDRLVAVGYSLGSTVAYDLASRYPDRFAAIADVSGGCPRHPTPLTNLRHLNTYVFHGTEDDLVPIKVAHDIDAYFAKFELPHVLDIVEGGEHAYPKTPERGARIRDWLRQQKRDAWPRAVHLTLYPPVVETHRIYWLELHRTDGKGAVAASVADNVVTIESAAGVGRVVLHLGEPLVDLDREVVVKLGAKEAWRGKLERRFATLVEDLERDGWDGVRAAPARIAVSLGR